MGSGEKGRSGERGSEEQGAGGVTSAIHRAAGAIISAPSSAIPIESSGADTGAGAGACEKNMLSTNERSSPRSASVWASRVSGEGSTAGCCGTLPSRASLTSHKLMELRTPVRCLRTRGQLDELPPPLLSPSQSTLMLPSDWASAALSIAVECARPHVWGATGSLRTVGASTCSLAAMAVCSSQMVGASRLRVKAFFPLRFGGAVSAYARRARGTMGDPALAPAMAGSGPALATPIVDLSQDGTPLPPCLAGAKVRLGLPRRRKKRTSLTSGTLSPHACTPGLSAGFRKNCMACLRASTKECCPRRAPG